MNAFLQPSIRLLNRLRYPQKFALISFFFALPLLLALYSFWAEMNQRIAFTRQEMQGMSYLEPLQRMLEHLPQSMSLANAFLRGESFAAEHLPNKQAEIDGLFESLAGIDQRYGDDLKVRDLQRVLRSNWDDLKKQLPGMTPAISDDLHRKLSQDIRVLMARVGDNSNLILDPDLDSYYVMDAVLLKLPESMDSLARIRYFATHRNPGSGLSGDERAWLALETGVLDTALAKTKAGLAVAFEHNRAAKLRAQLDSPAAQYFSATDNILKMLRTQALEPAHWSIHPESFQSLAAAALIANSRLWQRSAGELRGLLQQRIDSLAARRDVLLAITLAAVLLVAYFWLGLYRSVMTTVEHMQAAAERLRAGQQDLTVPLDNRDEFGDVTRAFNTVARALIETGDKYRSIVENSLDGFFQTTLDGHYLAANPALARMYGYASVEALMADVQNISQQLYVAPGRREEFARLMSEHGVITAFESQVYRKDGSIIWISENVRLIRNSQGEALYYEGMVQDITAKKQVQEDLRLALEAAESANHAKSEFLANMSHEIRTPMNAILGFSELLATMIRDPKQKSYLSAISSSGRALLTIINDILDLSKIEAGKLDLEYDTISLAGVLEEIRQIFSQKAEQKHLDLRLEVDPHLPAGLLMDEVRLRQVMINVVGNALKFTESGHVTMRARQESYDDDESKIRLVIEVEDSGIGIPEADRQRIFEAFAQQSGQSNRKYGGTGLGLTITKRLVEMMQGHISLRSEPGHGTNFRFVFPEVAISAPHPQTMESLQAVADLAQFEDSRIIVTDDVDLNRDLIKCYFEGTRHTLYEACNGKEAVELARLHLPNLILMDVRMPVMDGLQATRILKADDRTRHIPIVVVTASAMKSEEEAIKPLCDAFVKKPVSKLELMAELKRLLPLKHDYVATTPQPETVGTPLAGGTRADAEAVLPLLLQEQPVWATLQAAPVISEVRDFALRLMHLAEAHPVAALLQYAQTLYQQVEQFDMVRFPQTLEAFPQLLETIRQHP